MLRAVASISGLRLLAPRCQGSVCRILATVLHLSVSLHVFIPSHCRGWSSCVGRGCAFDAAVAVAVATAADAAGGRVVVRGCC